MTMVRKNQTRTKTTDDRHRMRSSIASYSNSKGRNIYNISTPFHDEDIWNRPLDFSDTNGNSFVPHPSQQQPTDPVFLPNNFHHFDHHENIQQRQRREQEKSQRQRQHIHHRFRSSLDAYPVEVTNSSTAPTFWNRSNYGNYSFQHIVNNQQQNLQRHLHQSERLLSSYTQFTASCKNTVVAALMESAAMIASAAQQTNNHHTSTTANHSNYNASNNSISSNSNNDSPFVTDRAMMVNSHLNSTRSDQQQSVENNSNNGKKRRRTEITTTSYRNNTDYYNDENDYVYGNYPYNHNFDDYHTYDEVRNVDPFIYNGFIPSMTRMCYTLFQFICLIAFSIISYMILYSMLMATSSDIMTYPIHFDYHSSIRYDSDRLHHHHQVQQRQQQRNGYKNDNHPSHQSVSETAAFAVLDLFPSNDQNKYHCSNSIATSTTIDDRRQRHYHHQYWMPKVTTILKPYQSYYINVLLELPESEHNRNGGMFGIVTELYGISTKTPTTTRKTATSTGCNTSSCSNSRSNSNNNHNNRTNVIGNVSLSTSMSNDTNNDDDNNMDNISTSNKTTNLKDNTENNNSNKTYNYCHYYDKDVNSANGENDDTNEDSKQSSSSVNNENKLLLLQTSHRSSRFPYESSWISIVRKIGTELPMVLFLSLLHPFIRTTTYKHQHHHNQHHLDDDSLFYHQESKIVIVPVFRQYMEHEQYPLKQVIVKIIPIPSRNHRVHFYRQHDGGNSYNHNHGRQQQANRNNGGNDDEDNNSHRSLALYVPEIVKAQLIVGREPTYIQSTIQQWYFVCFIIGTVTLASFYFSLYYCWISVLHVTTNARKHHNTFHSSRSQKEQSTKANEMNNTRQQQYQDHYFDDENNHFFNDNDDNDYDFLGQNDDDTDIDPSLDLNLHEDYDNDDDDDIWFSDCNEYELDVNDIKKNVNDGEVPIQQQQHQPNNNIYTTTSRMMMFEDYISTNSSASLSTIPRTVGNSEHDSATTTTTNTKNMSMKHNNNHPHYNKQKQQHGNENNHHFHQYSSNVYVCGDDDDNHSHSNDWVDLTTGVN